MVVLVQPVAVMMIVIMTMAMVVSIAKVVGQPWPPV